MTIPCCVGALRFEIPRQSPSRPFDYYGDELIRFEGVIGHANVRRDKTDPAPTMMLWNALHNHAGVRPVPITPPARAGTPALSRRELDTLFAENVRVLDDMDVAAASLVKALQATERRLLQCAGMARTLRQRRRVDRAVCARLEV